MDARVLVVSDSHLSPRTPEAHDHWDAVVRLVAAERPDLVVHAGDLSADGPVHEGDLDDARARLHELDGPVVAVPGNHDVGDAAVATHEGEPVLTAAAVSRWRDRVGPDRFSLRLGAWHLVGLDAQLLGSGDALEDDQWAWLDRELAAHAGAGPVAVVLHKPLSPPPGEHDTPRRYVPAEARARLLARLADVDLRLVVSGHVHQALDRAEDGIRHVWVPSCWGLVPDHVQRAVGTKRVGVVVLTLHADGRSDAEQRRLPGVPDATVGVDVRNPYGEIAPVDSR